MKENNDMFEVKVEKFTILQRDGEAADIQVTRTIYMPPHKRLATKTDTKEAGKKDSKLSLHPLKFEEAVKGLLEVKPEPKKQGEAKADRASTK